LLGGRVLSPNDNILTPSTLNDAYNQQTFGLALAILSLFFFPLLSLFFSSASFEFSDNPIFKFSFYSFNFLILFLIIL